MRKSSSLWCFLFFVLFALSHASAKKLRGTKARKSRKLNENELLIAEGRRGDDGKNYKGGEAKQENWASGSSVDGPASLVESGDVSASPDSKQTGQTKNGKGGQTKTKVIGTKGPTPTEPGTKVPIAASTKVPSGPGTKVPSGPGTKAPSETGAQKSSTGPATKNKMSPAQSPSEDGDVPRDGASVGTPAPKGANGGSDKLNAENENAQAVGNGNEESVSEEALRTGSPDMTTTQVQYVLSQFGLQFQLSDTTASIPSTTDFAEVEAETIGYIEEYLDLTYSADEMIFFEKVEIEVTSRRTGGTTMTPFIDFEASVAFASNSPMTPTSDEIALTIAQAFSEGTDLSTYLFSLAQRLGDSNPFLSTTKVTVYVPDTSNSSGSGRVASGPNKMSAAGIAAAASTGFLTLVLGGVLLFKIKRENEDLQGGKYGKGSPGGETLAGDTYDTSTLEPSASLPNEDAGSLDASYQDDRSFLSAALPDQTYIRKIVAKAEYVEETEASDTDSVPFDCSPASGAEGNEASDEEVQDADADADSDPDENEEGSVEQFRDEEELVEDGGDSPMPNAGGVYASLVGRTKSLVPSFKQSVPMSNVDIKNYFKAKYNCISPLGYDAVDNVPSGDDGVASGGDEGSHGRIHDSGDLVLPALDHDTVASSKKENEDISLLPTASLGNDETPQDEQGEGDSVPALPTKSGDSNRSKTHQWEPRSAGRSFDEISLDTMGTMTEI